MSNGLTRFRPSPAMGMALVAIVLSATGLAVAAIPDSKGVIHSCYAKSDGALRVVSGKKCQSGEKKLAWNKQGKQGKPGKHGAAGATNVKVRSANVTLHYGPCGMITVNVYSCTAPGSSATAHCNPGERSTGGGYAQPTDGAGAPVTESKPAPASGTPTGWTVTVSGGFAMSSTSSHPDTEAPIYAICAAP